MGLNQRSIVREGVVVASAPTWVEVFVSDIGWGIGEMVQSRRLERTLVFINFSLGVSVSSR